MYINNQAIEAENTVRNDGSLLSVLEPCMIYYLCYAVLWYFSQFTLLSKRTEQQQNMANEKVSVLGNIKTIVERIGLAVYHLDMFRAFDYYCRFEC